jgi:hypothetical protein
MCFSRTISRRDDDDEEEDEEEEDEEEEEEDSDMIYWALQMCDGYKKFFFNNLK